MIFCDTNTDFVLCIDCHVLLEPGSLRKLLDYFHVHLDTPDLLQYPLIYDDFAKPLQPSGCHLVSRHVRHLGRRPARRRPRRTAL